MKTRKLETRNSKPYQPAIGVSVFGFRVSFEFRFSDFDFGVMTLRTLIRRSLRHHWRAHLGVTLGAAIGSAA